MRKLIWLFLVIIAFVSCKNNDVLNSDEAMISGVLQNAKDKIVMLVELTPTGEMPIDTAIINSDGKFSFKIKIEYASLYLLRTDNAQNFITILPDSLEDIIVTGDYENLPEIFDIKGSWLTDTIKELQHLVHENKMYLDSLAKYWDQHKYDEYAEQIKSVLDEDYETQRQKQKDYQISLINNNRHSIVPVFVLFQRFGTRGAVFSEHDDDDFEFMINVIADMQSVMPDNPHVVGLMSRFTHLKNLKRQQELEQQKMQQAS